MRSRWAVPVGVAVLWVSHVAVIAALPLRRASVASNFIQLIIIFWAAFACWQAGDRSSLFVKRIARLMSASCLLWAIGQAGYLYDDLVNGGNLPEQSATDLPFFAFYVPLALAVFQYPQTEQRRDWIRTLDFAQVAILLSAIYLYFFVFLAAIADSRRAFLGLGYLSVWDLLNGALTGLFFYRASSSRFRIVRSLFFRIAIVLLLYSIGDGIYSFARGFLNIATGSWFDMTYSIPFGAAALAAWSWEGGTDLEAETIPTEMHAGWWASLFPLLSPFLVLLMSAQMLARFAALAVAIVTASFACLTLRLVFTQNRQEQAAQRLRAVNEANLALSRSLDLDTVLNTLLEKLHTLVPFDTANVMLSDGPDVVVRAARGYEKWTQAPVVGMRFSPDNLKLWGEMLKGATMIVSDTHRDPRWVVMEETRFVRNWLAVPIRAGGRVIGFYSFDKSEPNFFTDEHARIAESLAAQAAVAIENARLYEERAKSKQVLVASEEKFTKAFHGHPNPMVISRLSDGKIIEINRSYVEFFGQAREETLGRTANELHTYADPGARDLLVEKIMKEHRILDEEVRLCLKSGEIRTVLASADLLEVDGEKCILGVIRDITDRVKAQRALQVSEERFSRAFQGSPVPMLIATIPEVRTAEINDAFLRLAGFTREEAMGRTGQELGTMVSAQRRDELVQHLMNIGRIENASFSIRTRSGEIREMLISAELIDFGGQPHALVAGLDITERRKAEEALKSSEERFMKAFRASPAAMTLLSLNEGRYVDANESFARMAGFPREEIIGRSPDELGLTADSNQRRELFEQLRLEGRLTNREFAIRHRSGKLVYGLISAEMIQLGGAPHALFVGLDLTEQRQLEERFRKAFHASPLAMSISTLDRGVYVDINEGYTRMTGYQTNEVIGKSALDLGIWVDARERARMLQKLRNHDGLQNWEMEIRTKGGEVRNALLSADVIDLDGKPHLLSALLDLTQYRQLEEQLRQAQKMEAIGRLAGGVAHDFNNLLMVIIGRCDLAMAKLDEKNPAAPSVEEAQRAAWKAASLTRQLLAFSRKQVLQPQVINLNTVTNNMMKLLMRMIGEDVTLVFRGAQDLGQVKADPGGIEQILMNLCVNARDAMPGGGRLTIETVNKDLDESYVLRHGVVPPGRYVMIAVSDTGAGMNSVTQARIFEPFFTTKEEGKGTGLGLSTVYGIVKQSGGFIWVYSEPGKGATFKIYLPRVDEPAVTSDAGESAVAVSRGEETILVVEDDPLVRELSTEFLRGAGYKVLVSTDGRAGLATAQQHQGKIHLVLTDVVMPGMGGQEMVEKLVPLRPGVKVIYLSGYADEAITSHGELPHGHAFMQKPFRMGELASKVREVLDS